MSRYARSLIALGAMTLIAHAALFGVGRLPLMAGPEGFWPLDMRPLGYTRNDALLVLSQRSARAAAAYLGPMRALDALCPALLALFAGWGVWGLTRRLHLWSRIVLLIAPGGYALMALCENALLAEMVARGVHALPATLVQLASAYTVSKFVTLFVAFGLLLVLIGLQLHYKGRLRRT